MKIAPFVTMQKARALRLDSKYTIIEWNCTFMLLIVDYYTIREVIIMYVVYIFSTFYMIT